MLNPSALWPHQARAIAASRAAYAGKLPSYPGAHRAILLVAPTGSGKTRMGTHYAGAFQARGQRALWLAHREELITQPRARLIHDGIPAGDIGLVQADRPRDPSAHVQVASVQTLVSMARRGLALPGADLVIFDEAHHYVADEWGQVAGRYAAALRIGLTATPVHPDGRPLGDLFTALIPVAGVRELIDAGYLADFDVIGPGAPQDGLARDPAEALTWGSGPAVAFLPSVEMARELAAKLGPRAAVVTGETGDRVREKALADFEAGRIDVLVNCMVLTEGWDSKRVRRVVLARGCTSWATWRQIVGRGLRADPSDPAKRCTIIDLRGAVHVHGMPDEDVTFSLDGKGYHRPTDQDLPAIRQCPACWWIGAPPSDQVCPRCARRFPPLPRPKITGAALRELKSVASREEKQRTFDRLCREAQAKGYKPGWIGFRFEGIYGHRPVGFQATREAG